MFACEQPPLHVLGVGFLFCDSKETKDMYVFVRVCVCAHACMHARVLSMFVALGCQCINVSVHWFFDLSALSCVNVIVCGCVCVCVCVCACRVCGVEWCGVVLCGAVLVFCVVCVSVCVCVCVFCVSVCSVCARVLVCMYARSKRDANKIVLQ